MSRMFECSSVRRIERSSDRIRVGRRAQRLRSALAWRARPWRTRSAVAPSRGSPQPTMQWSGFQRASSLLAKHNSSVMYRNIVIERRAPVSPLARRDQIAHREVDEPEVGEGLAIFDPSSLTAPWRAVMAPSRLGVCDSLGIHTGRYPIAIPNKMGPSKRQNEPKDHQGRLRSRLARSN